VLPQGLLLAGRYLVIEWAGRDGLTEVYRAWDSLLGTPVRLEALPAAPQGIAPARWAQQLASMRTEAELGAQLQHRGLVEVTGLVRSASGDYVLVRKDYAGASLADELHSGRTLPAMQTTSVFRQVCSTLRAISATGMLNGRLEAGSIWLSGERVRLTSLGASLRPAPVRSASEPWPAGLNSDPAAEASLVQQIGRLMVATLTGNPCHGQPLALRPRALNSIIECALGQHGRAYRGLAELEHDLYAMENESPRAEVAMLWQRAPVAARIGISVLLIVLLLGAGLVLSQGWNRLHALDAAPVSATPTYTLAWPVVHTDAHGDKDTGSLPVRDARDTYEPDEGHAALLQPGVQQAHTFYPQGDTDWVMFPVQRGWTYMLQAINQGDAQIQLDVNDGAQNWQGISPAAGQNALVTLIPSQDSTALVKVSALGTFGEGSAFVLYLTEFPPDSAPPAPEPTREIVAQPTRTPRPVMTPLPTAPRATAAPGVTSAPATTRTAQISATPKPSLTPTRTRTPRLTRSATLSRTPTITPTPTPSLTPTSTDTPVPSTRESVVP